MLSATSSSAVGQVVMERRLSPVSITAIELEDRQTQQHEMHQHKDTFETTTKRLSLVFDEDDDDDDDDDYDDNNNDEDDSLRVSSESTASEDDRSSSCHSVTSSSSSTTNETESEASESSSSTLDLSSSSSYESSPSTTHKTRNAVKSVRFASCCHNSSDESGGWGTESTSKMNAAATGTPLERIFYIESRFDLLWDNDTSKSDLWYTSSEYRLMKDRDEQIVKLLNAGILQSAEAAKQYLMRQSQASTSDADDDVETNSTSTVSEMICVLGLEGSYGKEKRERSRLRRRSVFAVLLEQDMQEKDGYSCDDLMADMYKDYSIEAQETAYKRANNLSDQLRRGVSQP